RIRRSDGDLDAAPRLAGQAGRDVRPGLAAVLGAHQGAAADRVRAFAAGTEGPAPAAEVPHAREEDVRVLRVHRQARAARREVASLQDQAPVAAAVGRLVDAALGAVAPELAGNAGVDRVARRGVHEDPDDVLGVLQAHVLPGLAAVGGLVDAVADRDRVAHPGLPRPDPHGLRAGGVDRDRSDGLHGFLVEDRLEGRPPV